MGRGGDTSVGTETVSHKALRGCWERSTSGEKKVITQDEQKLCYQYKEEHRNTQRHSWVAEVFVRRYHKQQTNMADPVW